MADIRIKDLTTTALSPAADDYDEMDGATNGSRKILTRLKYAAEFAQRVGSGQVISDGATTNRALIQTPGARGNLAGGVSATWRGLVTVPTSNPVTTLGLFAVQSSATVLGGIFSLCCFIGTTGAISIEQQGTPVNTHINKIIYPAFRATYSGQTGILEVYITPSAVVVRWNDVDISSAFSSANIGTPPPWLDPTLVGTFQLTGYNWPAGPAPLGCWINGALTTADREYWRATGNAPYWVAAGGSQALAISSDFSAGVDGFGAAQGAVVGNVDGIGGVDNVLELNTAGGTGAATSRDIGLGNLVGRTIRLRFDVYRPSANTTGTHINIRDGGSGLLTPTLDFVPVADTWTSYDVVLPMSNSTSALQFRLAIGATTGGALGTGDKAYFKNVRVNLMGALSLPGVQPIPVIDDWTGLGGNAARLVGMTPVTDNRYFRISADTASSAAGGVALLGGDILDSTRDVIDTMEQSTTGTPTVSVGHLTGSLTTYKASAALVAGINPTTLVTRKLAGNQVWVASSTTDTVRTTITGHRTN
ncbi:MAG: hypothetical protein K0R17_1027 [Rariglobus sp.]|jgi:hypothetical protein|nr:hypothetical protein [Rariglobus sp.]